MDTTLLSITLVSLVIALVLALVTWRVIREERRRSAARVAALAADLAASEPLANVELQPRTARQSAVAWQPWPAAPPGATGTHEGDRVRRVGAGARAAAPTPQESEAEAEAAPGGPPGLFSTVQRPSRRLLSVATLSGVGVLIIGAVAVSLVGFGDATGRASSASVSAAGTAPLELLSLSHAAQGDALSITGRVRNPSAGPRVTRVAVAAMLFDLHGSLVTSGRAGLDVVALDPGGESPFAMTVPGARAVSRYRISFRTEDGRVLPHVDRRHLPPARTVDGR